MRSLRACMRLAGCRQSQLFQRGSAKVGGAVGKQMTRPIALSSSQSSHSQPRAVTALPINDVLFKVDCGRLPLTPGYQEPGCVRVRGPSRWKAHMTLQVLARVLLVASVTGRLCNARAVVRSNPATTLTTQRTQRGDRKSPTPPCWEPIHGCANTLALSHSPKKHHTQHTRSSFHTLCRSAPRTAPDAASTAVSVVCRA